MAQQLAARCTERQVTQFVKHDHIYVDRPVCHQLRRTRQAVAVLLAESGQGGDLSDFFTFTVDSTAATLLDR